MEEKKKKKKKKKTKGWGGGGGGEGGGLGDFCPGVEWGLYESPLLNIPYINESWLQVCTPDLAQRWATATGLGSPVWSWHCVLSQVPGEVIQSASGPR